MATSNVRKTLTDAGYIAIGLGVMGFQQAQNRRRELLQRAQRAGECVQKNTRDAQHKLQEQSRTARSRSRWPTAQISNLLAENCIRCSVRMGSRFHSCKFHPTCLPRS